MKTKNKIIAFILCCIMVASSIPLTGFKDLVTPLTASANETAIYYGDLNENGRVEASDARLVLQKAASLITLTDRQMTLADVNTDGRVTAIDARTVLRTAAKLEAPVVFVSSEPVSQGEYITKLMAELGLSGTGNQEQFFDTVPPENDCYDAVQSAVEWNILEADKEFNPDDDTTVEFAVTAAEKALAHNNITEKLVFVSNDTDMKSSCSPELAEEIISKAKAYKLNRSPEDTFSDIVVKDTVENFDASEITAVSDSEFTFDSFGDEKPEKGDIFITESEYGQTAEKIESVTDNGDGTYTVTTVQPDMDEVFDDFAFVDYATPDVEDVSFTPAPGAFVIEDTSAFETFTDRRAKDESKDVLAIALNLNSNNTPGMLPDMCCTLSSDYIEALNMAAENKDIPNSKTILEEYNQQLEILAGKDGKNTVVATPVKKYESGWTFNAALKFSNFEVDFNFKDFWTTGNYEISFFADVTELIDFEGTLNAEKHLGTLHFTHGIQKIFFNIDIEVYAYIDINGKVVVSGQGKIAQTYGNYDGRTDSLNNNAFQPHLEANINAEAGIDIRPSMSTLGFELAALSIQIGVNGAAKLKVSPLVEYKDTLFVYAGDAIYPPEELNSVIFVCLDLELRYPIIRITVSAGEDVKNQIEKLKKKNEDIPNFPLDHTFKICTLDKDSLLTPLSSSVHIETTTKTETVKKCTDGSYKTLADRCSGYVVEKDTDKVIPDAVVNLLDKDNNIVSSATTDTNGEFDLRFIPYGEYSVSITSDGSTVTLDEKVTIEQNETNIGKLEFEVDIVNLYVDFLKKQGKTTRITTPYDDTYSFLYCDSAICYLKKSDTPQLIITYLYSYAPTANFYACRVYEIENSKVVLKKEVVSDGAVGVDTFSVWMDPYKNERYLVHRISGHGVNIYENIFPYPNFIGYCDMNPTKWGQPADTDYAANYRNYLNQFDHINDAIENKTIYELNWQSSSTIRIAVIDENNKYEIKTFSF